MRLSIKKKLFFLIVLLFLSLLPSFSWLSFDSIVSPLGSKAAGPLLKYSFENLRKRNYESNPIIINRILKQDLNFTSYLFFYQSDGKKISGLLNIPIGEQPGGGWPVVIMLRGYVDSEIYYTGIGTQKAGEYFAKNGYVILSPDFLGFGESDPITTPDILEDRFEKPIEVLNLLASVPSLRASGCERGNLCVNSDKIFLWAHSNGGQIALSVLEIAKQKIPTVLWAPVTKGFPDSVLVYLHELDDNGKRVKAAIDKFELDYESDNYSIKKYFKDIKSPLEVHQGTGDELVDEAWTSEFVRKMRSLGKTVDYYTYPGADHNLSGGKDKATGLDSWQSAVSRSLDFYDKF